MAEYIEPPLPSVKGATVTEEWRVSWTMWVPERPQPQDVARVYEGDEQGARDQLAGLQSMLADHPMDDPCPDHIWRPTLDRRTVWQGPWRPVVPA